MSSMIHKLTGAFHTSFGTNYVNQSTLGHTEIIPGANSENLLLCVRCLPAVK